MNSVHRLGKDRFIEQKSEFIGVVKPINSEDEALKFVEKIKEEYPKATHYCYAYILGEHQNIQRFQDDGEPSGTAGIPMLEVLKKRNLTNVIVVAVRYFGGILLGTGGLARAYTKSAVIGIKRAKVVEKEIAKTIILTVAYEFIGTVDYTLRQKEYFELNREYGAKVEIKLMILERDYPTFICFMEEIFSGQIEILFIEESLVSVEQGKILR